MDNNNTPDSRPAFRRLMIVLGIAVAVVVYAYGFEQTEVSLDETQDEVRQASVTRALRELFAPDIFDQDTESEFASANFVIGCGEDSTAVEQPAQTDGDPFITLSTTCGTRDDMVTIEGFDFHASTPGVVRWIPPGGEPRPVSPIGVENPVFDINRDGYFKVELEVPRLRSSEGEIHEIQVEARRRVGLPRTSDATELVIEKMFETVFTALMATTFAIPIAFAISFLAARNLMRQVHIPAGNVLIGFLLFPVGWILGNMLIGAIGQAGFDLGTGDLFDDAAEAAAPAIILLGSTVATGATRRRADTTTDLTERLRRFVMNIGIAVAAIFVFGLLGGVITTIGGELNGGFIGTLGNALETIGALIDATVGFFAALAGGLLLSTTAVSLSQSAFKSLTGVESHVLGAVLGALSGGLLLGIVALVGTQGALLGLLAPVVAAVLGARAAAAVFNWVFNVDKHKHNVSQQTETTRFVVSVVGAVAIFIIAASVLDLSRALVGGRLPLDDEFIIFGITFPVRSFIGNAVLIGGILSGIIGALTGVHQSISIGMTIYTASRTILNALRSVEPLIMGIVFVIWVGVGPFAGVLALTLHSIAALGKLYSEQIENIDNGPIEAVQATGATRLQTIIYAVVPQIIPPYIAFTLYRWDINVRMSTIIGFVGGGGIGFVLQQQINLLRYRDAGVAMLAIAIVVSILDYASAAIRERII